MVYCIFSSILLSFLDGVIARVTRVSFFTYARVRAATRRLLTIPGGAGGGAGYGQPVRGAHRVTDLTHQSRDRGLPPIRGYVILTITAESPPDGEEMEKASVS